MTENNEEAWDYDGIEIDDDGKVVGSAYRMFNDGYDVTVSVFSYEYRQNGETHMNHVPHVVVNNPDGAIVSEPEARDSSNAEKAIENAKNLGEYVYENTQDFIN